tara:strand:- start:22306 stop:23802 length:1497 start_codon:yes stop_codon:yes gene_type:complete
MAQSILDLSPADFRATIDEMQANGSNTDELVRQYRAQNSVFSPINNAADAYQRDLAGAGRRPVLGGLLSKEIGTTGMDALRSIDFEGMGGLLGMGQALGQTLDAPAAAAQGLIPRSDMEAEALGTAGLAMGAGGAVTAPDGALLSGLARPGPSERGVNKGDLDPLGYGATRLDDYLDNTDLNLRDLGENLPRTQRSWEDLAGGYALPFYGDRTSRGFELNGINDTQFSRPVYTEGGVDFMRGPANQSDGAVWASAKHIIDRLEGAAARTRRDDPEAPIYGVTGSMAPDGVDFANFSGEAMAELVSGNRSGINLEAARGFDDKMLEVSPTFPGLLSDNLRDWAGTTTSPERKAFIRKLDAKPMRQAGVPSAALARYGVTDPSSRNVPSGQFGAAVAELRPGTPLMYNEPVGNGYRATNPHTTYNTQMQGDYVGELPLIPQGLLFRDAYDRMGQQLDKNGNPLGEANKTYAIKTQLQPQLITPRIIDGIMDFLSKGQGPQ